MKQDKSVTRALRLVSLFEKGELAPAETAARIFECITRDNVARIMTSIPEDFALGVRSRADNAPTSETEWDQLRFFRGTGYFDDGALSDAEIEAQALRVRSEYRRRIEAIRWYMTGAVDGQNSV